MIRTEIGGVDRSHFKHFTFCMVMNLSSTYVLVKIGTIKGALKIQAIVDFLCHSVFVCWTGPTEISSHYLSCIINAVWCRTKTRNKITIIDNGPYFFSPLPNRSKWPNCASSERLTSMIDFGKIGELSFKSSISMITLNSLNMLCGVVIISALKRHRSTSRSHTVSRSIVVRVRKSPDFVSIWSSSSPLTIWNCRSSNEAWNWASCPILPIYESAYINDADVFISDINEKKP